MYSFSLRFVCCKTQTSFQLSHNPHVSSPFSLLSHKQHNSKRPFPVPDLAARPTEYAKPGLHINDSLTIPIGEPVRAAINMLAVSHKTRRTWNWWGRDEDRSLGGALARFPRLEGLFYSDWQTRRGFQFWIALEMQNMACRLNGLCRAQVQALWGGLWLVLYSSTPLTCSDS